MHSSLVESESLLSRDASKRKRVNRSAKLKQYKLDVRREQWLAQVQSGGKQNHSKDQCGRSQDDSSEGHSPKSVDFGSKDEETIHAGFSTGDSDTDSCVINQDDVGDYQSNGACGGNWKGLSLGGPLDSSEEREQNVSGTGHTTRIECGNCQSNGCSPGSCADSPTVINPPLDITSKKGKGRRRCGRVKSRVNMDERRDEMAKHGEESQDQNSNGCDEDDWEAAADALCAKATLTDSTVVPISPNISGTPSKIAPESGILKPRYSYNMAVRNGALKGVSNGGAWRPGDTSRPVSLPKVESNSTRLKEIGNNKDPIAAPQCCPICIEELDSTDSSFVPCACGFRLCLFCHHRILLEDGRCPGCRRIYDTDLPMKMSRGLGVGLLV